jgi:ABC-type sugar transport system permease subunit
MGEKALQVPQRRIISSGISWPRFRASARKTLRKPQFWFGLTMLVPTLAWYFLFAFRPIFMAFRIAFQRYNLLNPAMSRFVGLDNFRQLLQTDLLLIAVRNTVVWSVLAFSIGIPFALFVAFLLTNVKHGRNFYQGLIYLPCVVSLVAISLLFRMLLDPQVGQVNQILTLLGLPNSAFLNGPDSALITCVMIGIWKGIGGTVIILTAGMLNIPQELQDAALVDGASGWKRFRFVTLPLMAHTLLLVTILMAIGTLQEFTAPFILTGGGPGNATFTYNMLLYNQAFQSMRFGVATAAALLQFAVIIVISLGQLKLLRPNWSY